MSEEYYYEVQWFRSDGPMPAGWEPFFVTDFVDHARVWCRRRVPVVCLDPDDPLFEK